MREDIKDLGEITRLVLMVEVEPLSDMYYQVKLDKETFKKISDIAWNSMPDSPNKKEGEDRKTILVEPMKPVKIPNLLQAEDPPNQ